MKKGQSSIEFMVLLGFAIILASTALVVISSDAERRFDIQNEEIVNEVFDVVETEILLAKISPPVYTREFFLPPTLEGKNYTINIVDNRDIVVNFNNDLYVFFLNQTIAGNIQKGDNTIVKTCVSQFSCEIRLN